MHILILDDMNNQLEAQAVFTHEEGATYWTGEWAPQLLGE
jgi:hypothetical protein